jgi:hypothetical protein
MTLSDLASIGSFVSGLAVLISLIYLALQVRQAERNQRAIVQQARISRSSDQLMGLADPVLTRAWLQGLKGAADLSEEETFRFVIVSTAMLRNVEDVYFQHDLGLLDETSLENQLGPLRGFLRTRGGTALWRAVRSNYDQGFASRVDRLVPAETDAGQYGVIASWKQELANLEAQP